MCACDSMSAVLPSGSGGKPLVAGPLVAWLVWAGLIVIEWQDSEPWSAPQNSLGLLAHGDSYGSVPRPAAPACAYYSFSLHLKIALSFPNYA